MARNVQQVPVSELLFVDRATGEDKTESARMILREKAPELLELMAQVTRRHTIDTITTTARYFLGLISKKLLLSFFFLDHVTNNTLTISRHSHYHMAMLVV